MTVNRCTAPCHIKSPGNQTLPTPDTATRSPSKHTLSSELSLELPPSFLVLGLNFVHTHAHKQPPSCGSPLPSDFVDFDSRFDTEFATSVYHHITHSVQSSPHHQYRLFYSHFQPQGGGPSLSSPRCYHRPPPASPGFSSLAKPSSKSSSPSSPPSSRTASSPTINQLTASIQPRTSTASAASPPSSSSSATTPKTTFRP